MEQLALFDTAGPPCEFELPTVPDPHRCDALTVGTREWAIRGTLGHRCSSCGYPCGSSDHHIRCCGTEVQHRNTVGSYCSGHPCPGCHREPDDDEEYGYDDAYHSPVQLVTAHGRRTVQTITVRAGVL
jgi:hypothetical protein